MLCLLWVGLTIELLCVFYYFDRIDLHGLDLDLRYIFLTAIFCLNVNFDLNFFENVNLAVIYFFVEIVIFFIHFYISLASIVILLAYLGTFLPN
jgi:hypothetical protein